MPGVILMVVRRLTLLGTVTLAPLLLTGCDGKWAFVMTSPGFGDSAAIFTWVSISRSNFPSGETVAIEVGMRNPTTRPIELHFTSGCILSFVVKDPGDSVVAPMGVLCTADTPTIVLAPGARRTQRFEWDGTNGAPHDPLPPGEYQLVGGLDHGASGHPSQPVRIRIRAPEAGN